MSRRSTQLLLPPLPGRLARGLARWVVSALAWLSPARRAQLARWAGRCVFRLGIRRRVTLDNLARSLPELSPPQRSALARGAYENMALAAVEALTSVAMPHRALEEVVALENWGALKSAIEAGRGVLIATAHFGSWELLGELMARRGHRLHAVVRPLRGAFNERIIESRLQAGLGLIPARGAIGGVTRALKDGGVVAVLIDQVLPAKSAVFVPFFGRLAATSPALAAAAQRTGAPTFVVMGAREGGRLRMFVEGPFALPDTGDRHRDLVDHTAQLTRVIESYIRRYPDQWLWMHRRWKVAPPALLQAQQGLPLAAASPPAS